jgi:hypothetical protein
MSSTTATTGRFLLDRRPAAVATTLAPVTVGAAEGAGLAFVLGIIAFVYLAAAVLDRRSADWPLFGAGFVAVTATAALGGENMLLCAWLPGRCR